MSLSPFHCTLTVTSHFRLHLPSSTALIASAPVTNQASYKAPDFPIPSFCSPAWLFRFRLPSRLPFGLSLVKRIILLVLPAFHLLLLFDPACSTMYLSRPLNKGSHMDPLASRLSLPVTEQSVTTGSSSFHPGHSSDMDTDRILCRIKQGPHTLKQYTPFKGEAETRGSTEFMNFALLCVGSPCTVGVAKEERDNVDMAAAHSSRRLAVTPDHDATNKFSAWIACEMAAVSERALAMAVSAESVYKMMTAAPVRAHQMAWMAEPVHKMVAKMELRHVTAAIPEPYRVTAAFPESSQVSKSSQAAAVFPESSQVSNQVTAIFPEPLHKMAATPEPLHKMAAVSEPLHNMAAIPEQSQVRTQSKVKTQLPFSTSQARSQLFPTSQAKSQLFPTSQVTLQLLFLSQAMLFLSQVTLQLLLLSQAMLFMSQVPVQRISMSQARL
ncbi:Farnesol kinase, chloroplastic [Labeo rohita]|uniref:Farnesol kinase, chloroplastic n=1 Tax=Labeo rohita TaxID=84645 RepID=A0ABQ8L784_LABRO|nr:Farnesol kinase, chloroplastic [Labeo rohita]